MADPAADGPGVPASAPPSSSPSPPRTAAGAASDPAGSTGRSAAAGTSAASPAATPKRTPAMQQYDRFKAEHPGCVLFFRMGDFYEMFDDDAVLCHRVLGITLTERSAGTPMAGVPYHALEGYLRRMVESGHRVAVCDQVQDPKEARGVVERAVTRVVTPGTLVDEALLEEGAANRLVAVALPPTDRAGGHAAAALIELSTGRFEVATVPAGDLADELERLGPSEVVHAGDPADAPPAAVADRAAAAGTATTARAPWTFAEAEARAALQEHFGVRTLEAFGIEDDAVAIAACGALLRYVRETQVAGGAIAAGSALVDRSATRRPLAHLEPPRRLDRGRTLVVDATSLRSLEVERTMRTGQAEGSLLWSLRRCRTAMGKRLLRDRLCFPLRDLDEIRARHDRVGALVDDRALRAELAEALDGVQDVARIAGRLGTGRATPRDLVALGRSVGRLDVLAALLDGRPALAGPLDAFESVADALAPLAARIADSCVDDPPAHLREGGLLRDGVDPDLDEARRLRDDAGSWMADYQASLAATLEIPSLKVGYNRVFGYYIEVTHAHRDKVPDAFTRRQTLKNAERFVTAELKEFEDKVLSAEARAVERERALFDELCRAAGDASGAILRYADAVADLDVLLALADTAVRGGFVKPEMTEEPVLEIIDGRHPVLDRLMEHSGEAFVPNDARLGVPAADAPEGTAPATLALITGPNMAGKSTYIRQTALLALLAHTGSWVPAAKARIGLVDRIHTRIGASDELHTGRSTFMVEMTETAAILHHATEHSLVVLDEIGRGTSTLDGLALAWAIAETLAARRCRALFATHYHELTAIADELEGVTNLHVEVREAGDDIVFLHRISPGRTNRSYGIHVARIAGLPPATIDRAKAVLDSLAVHTDRPDVPPPDPAVAPVKQDDQLLLFAAGPTELPPGERAALDGLRAAALERMTPLDAFDLLRRLRAGLDGGDGGD